MERRIEMHGYENVENTQLRRLKSNIFDFGVVTAFVTLILFIINFFSIFQLVIGYMYRNNCPIEPAIPYYLIVAGVIELITTISSVLLVIYSGLVVQHNDREYDGVTARFAMWIVSSVCIHLLLVIFLFIWLILGCIWVFSVSHSVQYNDPSQQTYCHPTLYRFAYFVLVISIIWKVNNYVTQFYKNYNARS